MEDIISVERERFIRLLKTIDEIVGSLDRISRRYREDKSLLAEMLLKYFIDRKVAIQLSEARSLIASYFSSEVGPDDMDEVERILKKQNYWTG